MRILYCLFLAALISLGSCSKKNEDKAPSNTSDTISSQKDTALVKNNGKKKIIIFFGNSLTAGLGLDVSKAFPALIQNKLDSAGYNCKVVNAGISGETTASGKNRVAWVIKEGVDVFIIELGANDGLRGIPTEETEKNLTEMIDFIHLKYPEAKILLTGMMVPPNMGEAYTTYFKEVFPKVAKTKSVAFMPFLLEGVAGEPELNQKDGIHPTEKGHQIIANNLWGYLVPLL
ncbi:MAG: arylesterase [Cytophagales bacterium]|nr:arylesterase [Cytophagales bacterium]